MKKILLLFMSFLLLEACSSESVEDFGLEPEKQSDYVVTIDEAEKDLLCLLTDMNAGMPPTRSGEGRRISNKFSLGTPAATHSEEEQEPYVHIFNFEDEEGFAIMSGDERVPSLLAALTFDGSLCPESEIDNPGLAIFLSNLDAYYEECIVAAAVIGGGTGEPEPTDFDQSRVIYGPLENFFTASFDGILSGQMASTQSV